MQEDLEAEGRKVVGVDSVVDSKGTVGIDGDFVNCIVGFEHGVKNISNMHLQESPSGKGVRDLANRRSTDVTSFHMSSCEPTLLNQGVVPDAKILCGGHGLVPMEVRASSSPQSDQLQVRNSGSQSNSGDVCVQREGRPLCG